MIKFGAVTITHGTTNLGKTSGGGSLKVITIPFHNIESTYNKDSLVIGVEGTVNFYSWPTSIIITNSLQLYDFGIVKLTNSRITITLHACKIMLTEDIGEVGKNQHSPIKVLLVGKANTSGNVITIT